MEIFDIKNGKFLKKVKSGVVLADEKNGWIQRGDLFTDSEGREFIADFGDRIDINTKLGQIWLKQAQYKIKEIY